jgi:hypothetical protein
VKVINPRALEMRLQTLKKAEAIGTRNSAAKALANIGVDYSSRMITDDAIL